MLDGRGSYEGGAGGEREVAVQTDSVHRIAGTKLAVWAKGGGWGERRVQGGGCSRIEGVGTCCGT